MTATLPRLVALCGAAGSGKSAAADYLVEHYGYWRIKFAGPLKDMLYAIGLTHDEIEGHSKEAKSSTLCGRTPRYVMQTLGTEWGRNIVGPDLWVNIWRQKVERLAAENPQARIVVDDMRFGNELDAVKQLGGTRIMLHRANSGRRASDHVSESSLPVDNDTRVIINDGDLAQLHHSVLHELLR